MRAAPPSSADLVSLVEMVLAHVRTLEGFEIVDEVTGYDHMGALIADAVLQAGVKYTTFVVPRVNRILELYPDATTASGFLRVLEQDGAGSVLDLSGGHKPGTVEELARLLVTEAVETVEDLAAWTRKSDSRSRLLALKWIGPKTADYIGLLALRDDLVAVDTHLMRFLAEAGVKDVSYDEAAEILRAVACRLRVTPARLDHSIWLYLSRRHGQRPVPSDLCREPKKDDYH